MKFTEEMSVVIQKSPYLTFVTINADGTPHPIIVGGKEQKEDNIVIGIYKMDATRKNLTVNNNAWVTVATVDGGPKGFRFIGTASITDGKVIFMPDTAEVII